MSDSNTASEYNYEDVDETYLNVDPDDNEVDQDDNVTDQDAASSDPSMVEGIKQKAKAVHSNLKQKAEEVEQASDEDDDEKKPSKIPWDFDPSPVIERAPEGKQLPESQHYSSVVEPYKMTETVQLLTDDETKVKKMDLATRKARFLASKCVSLARGTRDSFYVKSKTTGTWSQCNMAGAKAQLKNDWIGCDKYNISNGAVDDFFVKNRYPVLDATIYVPNAPEFLTYRTERRLNTWSEQPLPFTPGSHGNENTLLMMRVIFNNLLNIPDVNTLEEMVEIISSEEDSLAKWFFNWLASVYQRPGRSLPTALWIVGLSQGTGKGMFSSMMKTLGGRANAYDANLKELRGEWNDFIGGSSLIVGDEMTFDSKKEFNDMLKRYVSSEEIALRKRGFGQYMVPNVTNWLFSTNNSRPVTIDENDRRNTFVATTEDEATARALASKFFRLSEAEKREAYEGIAELLNAIQIDDVLLSEAYHTAIKDEIIGVSRAPFLQWLSTAAKASDQTGWKVGDFLPSDKLYALFKTWAENNNYFHTQIARPQFDLQFGDAKKRGYVIERRKRIDDEQKRGAVLVKYPRLNVFDTEIDLPDETTTRYDRMKETYERAKGTWHVV